MSVETRILFTPATDGIDHINVYSRGRTAEGRCLTNFAPTPFTLHGKRFASVEGFYQSMLHDTPRERAEIAGLTGSEAKKWGNASSKKPGDPVLTWDGRTVCLKDEEFEAEIARALRQKVQENPEVVAALLATEMLPLTHYYVMWGRPVMPRGETGTLVGTLTALREECRAATPFPTRPDREVLVRVLRQGDEDERIRAAEDMVGHLSAEDADVIRALVEALEDVSWEVRYRAMRTLVQTDLHPAQVEEMLARACANESPVIREAIDHLLARY